MATRVCKNCKRQNIIIDYQSGDLVCTYCRVVQEQTLIDKTQEWRNFVKDATTAGDGNMSNRIGSVYDENFEDGGMGLLVGGQGADSKLFMKLTNRSGTDKQLKNVFQHIETIITQLEIGKEIFEVSKQIMKKVDESKKCKGKNEKAVACAVVFIACREKQESRTIKEIVEVLKAKKRDVYKAYSIIKKLENINLSVSNESAGEYAVRICTRLGIDKLSGYAKKQLNPPIKKIQQEKLLKQSHLPLCIIHVNQCPNTKKGQNDNKFMKFSIWVNQLLSQLLRNY